MAFVSSFVVGAGPVGGTKVERRPCRATVARRAVVPTAQFNYNIYQDGNERAKRTIGANDRAVQINKPLGIILEEGQDGMCFVASIDPNGNAGRTGQVQVGDIVVACSATFGDEIWSTRGVGLGKIMKSISVRSGNVVTLVLESPMQVADQKKSAAKLALDRRAEAREKFGEREVLDPNTWGSYGRATSPPEATSFEPGAMDAPDGYKEMTTGQPAFTPRVSEEELKRQLLEESDGQEKDNTILYGSVAFAVGLILIVFLLSR